MESYLRITIAISNSIYKINIYTQLKSTDLSHIKIYMKTLNSKSPVKKMANQTTLLLEIMIYNRPNTMINHLVHMIKINKFSGKIMSVYSFKTRQNSTCL